MDKCGCFERVDFETSFRIFRHKTQGKENKCVYYLLFININIKSKVTKVKYNSYQRSCSYWWHPHVRQASHLHCTEALIFSNIPCVSFIRQLQRCVLSGPRRRQRGFRRQGISHVRSRSNPYTSSIAINQCTNALDHHGQSIVG